MNPDCANCKGTGIVNDIGGIKIPCSFCNGTGKFEMIDPEKPWRCKYCNTIWETENNLKIHVKSAHMFQSTDPLERRPGSEGNKLLSDGREATLYETIFGGRILVGPPDCEIGGDEEFMYDSMILASQAYNEWDGYGQPRNWVRWTCENTVYRKGANGEPYRENMQEVSGDKASDSV